MYMAISLLFSKLLQKINPPIRLYKVLSHPKSREVALCAMPFHISAEEAGQTLPELSADPTAAEAETEPVQTDAPLTDLTDEPVVPIVKDFPYDPAFSMPETEYIPVEGIELAEFKDKIVKHQAHREVSLIE